MSSERKLEELLVPYARGELDPLEERWVAARLSDAERQRVESFSSAVRTVRDSRPELGEEHRARLVQRLNSMTPRRSTHPLLWAVPALALLLATGFALGWGASEHQNQESQPLAAVEEERFDFQDDEVPALEFPSKARAAITPHLRAIVSEDWEGRVDGDERETHVRVDRGRIAFGFHGGEGRRLEVSTEHARIVVTGTRFSVAVNPSGTETEVAVSQGRVEVWRGRRRVEIAAGDVAQLTESGLKVRRGRIEAVLDDPYLVEITKRRRARRPIDFRGMGSVEVKESPAPTPVLDLEGELSALETADAIAEAGRLSDAITAYQGLITRANVPMVRNMARLGRARVLGDKGQLRIALGELRLLAEEPGEIGRQARLSMCSVQRRFLPCDAMRCYEELSDDSDRELAAEARRETSRFRRARLRCD